MGDGAYEGVRVVELAQWVFVPVAGALLADWGADVVRVDRLEGDPYRGLATQGIGSDSGGVNLSLALANRGKRSIALDLRTDEGQTVLHQLLESADVFLTSFRPDALERLGLDAETLTKRYPSLVYARGNGYGVRGPDAGMAGYDASAYWARGGVSHVLTPADREYPITPRGAMGDRNGGMALAFGIASALLKRGRTGSGSVVDVSLLGMAMWTLSSDLLSALQGATPRAAGGRGPVINPLVGTYRTADGRHIQLVFLQSDRYWGPLCDLVNRADLRDDPRFVDHAARDANRVECVAALDELFASRTYEQWNELLRKLDAPWAPVQAVEELLTDPQVLANDYIGEVVVEGGPSYRLPTVPVQFDELPPELRPAPEHGEHTEAILLELGYGWDAIIALKDARGDPVTVRVPDELDEVLSPEWLSAALGTRFPGMEVTAVEPGPVISRVSTNAAFRIECAGGTPDGLSPDLVAKGYFGEGARLFRAIGESEAYFYRDLAERTGVRTLRCVWAGIEPESRHGVVITENAVVAGGRFLDALSDYSPDQVAESLEQLATLHAATWMRPAHTGEHWLEPRFAMIAEHRGLDVIEPNLEGPLGERIPSEARDPRRLHQAYPAVVAASATSAPWAVVHGDAHVGNIFVDGEGHPGLVDWQLVQRGAWYMDVGYHLASALAVDERRRHEDGLLRHYLEHLAACGVDAPTFDDARRDIALGMVHGYYLWAITQYVDPPIIAALLERIGTAVADHEAFAVVDRISER